MKIEKGNMTVEDTMDRIIETEAGVSCGCKKPQTQMVGHKSGIGFSAYVYKCICGNVIVANYKRDKDDMMMCLE